MTFDILFLLGICAFIAKLVYDVQKYKSKKIDEKNIITDDVPSEISEI